LAFRRDETLDPFWKPVITERDHVEACVRARTIEKPCLLAADRYKTPRQCHIPDDQLVTTSPDETRSSINTSLMDPVRRRPPGTRSVYLWYMAQGTCAAAYRPSIATAETCSACLVKSLGNRFGYGVYKILPHLHSGGPLWCSGYTSTNIDFFESFVISFSLLTSSQYK
jgi:hypothetical protein